MASSEWFSALVEDIYDAALAPDRWPQVLSAVAGRLGSNSAVLGIREPGGAFGRHHCAGGTPDAIDAYASRFYRIDPVLAAIDALPTGTVVTCHGVLDFARLRRTEFYGEFVEPHGLHDCFQAFAARDADCEALFAGSRTPRQGRFEGAQVEIVSALLPHVARAVRLHRRLAAAEALNDDLRGVLHRLPQPVFLVDADARITFMNEAAEAALRSGPLRSRSRVLTTDSPADADALRALVGRTAGPEAAASGGTLQVRGPGDARAVRVSATRLGRRSRDWLPASPGAQVALFVGEAQPPHPPVARQLQDRFGLTPCEAAVAQLAGDAGGVRSMAATLGVAPSTVRTHLARAFDKIGVHTQAELARRITRLATTHGPEPAARPAGIGCGRA